ACRYLPKAGDARWSEEALEVVRGEVLRLVGETRPRPHERHFALQHIDELRELIEACSAQPAPRGGYGVATVELVELTDARSLAPVHGPRDVGMVRGLIRVTRHLGELEHGELL